MEKKLEQKALVGSACVLHFPDKAFALKRAVFFMRTLKNRQKTAVHSGVILQKTQHEYTCPISQRRLAVLLARASKKLVAYREGIRDI